MKAPIDREVVAESASFGPPSHDRTVRVSSSLGRSASSHVRMRRSPYPLDVPPDGIRFEAQRSSDPKYRECTIGAELVIDGCVHIVAPCKRVRVIKELVRTWIGRQLAHYRRS